MFTNNIFYLKRIEFESIKEKLYSNKFYIVELQGEEIQTTHDFMIEMWKRFRFPEEDFINYDAYLDWIRDLDWIVEKEIVLIINNFQNFMTKNLEAKKEIIADFKEIILPWWERDIMKYVVGGKPKPFNIYLIG